MLLDRLTDCIQGYARSVLLAGEMEREQIAIYTGHLTFRSGRLT